MSETAYQFLTEVQKASEISGSWNEVYPFSYQVFYTLPESGYVYVTEYRALTHMMTEQVEKRWDYDFQDIDARMVKVYLRPEFSKGTSRDIN